MLIKDAILFVKSADNHEPDELIARFRADCVVRVCDYDYSKIVSNIGEIQADVVVFFMKDVIENDFIKQVSGIANPLVLFKVDECCNIPEIAEYDIPINIFKSTKVGACEEHIRMVMAYKPYKIKAFKSLVDDMIFSKFAVFRNQNLVGFRYMLECVNYCLFDEGSCCRLREVIYPWVAKKNDASTSSVQNAIRRYVCSIWDRRKEFPEQNIFSSLLKSEKMPSPDEFIYEAASRIFLEYRLDFYRYYQAVIDEESNKRSGTNI